MKYLVLTFLLGFAGSAYAETDTAQELTKLKQNIDYSSHNFDEYKKNFEISKKNVDETAKAIKGLKSVQVKLKANNAELKKNVTEVLTLKKQVVNLRTVEETKIKAERKQIEDLNKLIALIEKNIDQRNNNVKTYNLKEKDLETQMGKWKDQGRELASLNTSLVNQAKDVTAEREAWLKKRNQYLEKTKEWKAANKEASDTYIKYNGLKN